MVSLDRKSFTLEGNGRHFTFLVDPNGSNKEKEALFGCIVIWEGMSTQVALRLSG